MDLRQGPKKVAYQIMSDLIFGADLSREEIAFRNIQFDREGAHVKDMKLTVFEGTSKMPDQLVANILMAI
jgi:hypothetical protein